MQVANKGQTTQTTWIVAVIILLGLPVLILPFGGSHISQATNCLSRAKQIDLSSLMYASDYDDRMPLAWDWIEGGTPYSKQLGLYHCTQAVRTDYGYAYNSRLSGVIAGTISHPEAMPAYYDSITLVRDAADPVTSLPMPGRHSGHDSIAFADGHAKSLIAPSDQLSVLLAIASAPM